MVARGLTMIRPLLNGKKYRGSCFLGRETLLYSSSYSFHIKLQEYDLLTDFSIL